MLTWDDKYSSGIVEVDEQHKILFSYINTLDEDIRGDRIDEALENTLVLLEVYTKKHFNYEEDCMDKYKCSAAQKNKDEHDKFLEVLESFKSRIKNGEDKREVLQELYKLVYDWITRHICQVDIHLWESLRKND